MIRSEEEILREIKALQSMAKAFDTDRQSDNTCLAAGAHDALRWALGLAESPVSEYLNDEA